MQRYQNSQANYGQDEVVPLSELISHLMARCEAQSHEVRSPPSCTSIVATTGASHSLAHTHILQTICTWYYAQSAALSLGNDSLLNMVIYPLWTCVKGPPTQESGRIWGSAGGRCLRSGHNWLDLGRTTGIPLVIGGIRTGNLMTHLPRAVLTLWTLSSAAQLLISAY